MPIPTPGPFLTTTIAAYTAHNTSCNPAYNQTNFAANFAALLGDTAGSTWVNQAGTELLAVDATKSDYGFNPITPCHVSPKSVKTLIPLYSGKRIRHVEPYNFGGLGRSGQNPHLSIGVNTDTSAWASAFCLDTQARGYDGILIDWYGNSNPPNRVEDDITLLLQAQIATMTGFTFALMIDTTGGSYATLGELEAVLAYIQTTYFSDSNYRKFSSKPIVYMWGPVVLSDADYITAKASIATAMYWVGQGPASFAKSYMDAAFDWVQPYLNPPTSPAGATWVPSRTGVCSTDPYNSAAKLSFIGSANANPTKGNVIAVSPGFNGYETLSVGWSKGKYLPRDAGKCWLSQHALVNANLPTPSPLEILEVTGNDWEEASETESAIDNQIVVSTSLIGTTLNWSVSGGTGDESTIDHYYVLATPDGINAAVVFDQGVGGSKTINLSLVTGWTPGTTYNLFVVAQGVAGIRSQWNSSLHFTPSGGGGGGGGTSPTPTPVILTGAVGTPSGQIIPLTPDPNQTFEVPLRIDGTTKSLYLTLRYNEVSQYWVMTVATADGTIILDSVAFVTGNSPSGNILRQWASLRIGSAYVLNASGINDPDYPNASNLGTDFVLLWDDTPSS